MNETKKKNYRFEREEENWNFCEVCNVAYNIATEDKEIKETGQYICFPCWRYSSAISNARCDKYEKLYHLINQIKEAYFLNKITEKEYGIKINEELDKIDNTHNRPRKSEDQEGSGLSGSQ